jgi:indole-3-glycerol phosphate synthase
MNILEVIIKSKKDEVKEKKNLYPVKLLEKSVYFDSPTVSLKEYLLRKDKCGIIAEFKRHSPSKGDINMYADPEKVSLGYMQGGASALSVLTDETFFAGSNDDLITARKFNYCPILRKDFIIDEYQIYEAKSIGADAILLIASVLNEESLIQFEETAKSLDMEVLFEVHNEEELKKLDLDSEKIIGINNRDLKTFETNIDVSKRLSELIPEHHVKVSESGISHPSSIHELMKIGINGFLIGETFMKTADPGAACKSFIKELRAMQDVA